MDNKMIFYKGTEVYAPDKFLAINTGRRNEWVFKIGKIFYCYKRDGLFWFRFFNKWGLHGNDIRRSILLFSDMNCKRLKIGNWIFKLLK